MTRRVRVVSYYIKPEIMLDDGETLRPLELDAVRVWPAQWPQVVDLVEEALDRLRSQVEAPNGDAPIEGAPEQESEE